MSGAGFFRLRVVLRGVVFVRAVAVLLRLFGAVPLSGSDSVAGAAASISRGASAGGASTGDASFTEVCPSAGEDPVADGLSAVSSGGVAGTSAVGVSSAALAVDFLLPAPRLLEERLRGRAAFFSTGGDGSLDCSAEVVCSADGSRTEV